MKLEDFQEVIAKGESENVEFKTGSTPPETIAKVVCAFLNSGGGRVMLGIGDRGQLLGVANAKATARQLQNRLVNLISPRALWTVEHIHVDKRDIVIVEVPEGMDKPYVAGGAIYLRSGKDVVPASRNKISVLIQKGAGTSQRWERQMAMGADRVDLDEKLIRETVRMAVKSKRWQGSSNNTDTFLHGLGLIADGGVTNAALVLFGKRPSQLLPQARIRLLVMPKGKTGDRYALDKSFDSCLLRVADEISATLSLHAGGIESRFSAESWQRDDRQIYPMTALREGVMNALVHRDYSSSGSITISILPDSLQISNPGGLPEGLKPADLKRDHPSVPRNPDIAHVCFLRGLIEKVGRGTQRIVEDCREARLHDPKWQSSSLETTLTFFAPAAGFTQTLAEDLNDRQQQILAAVQERKPLSAGDVAKLLGGKVTDRTIRNDLQTLVNGQWLVRRGRGRSTLYVRGPKKELK